MILQEKQSQGVETRRKIDWSNLRPTSSESEFQQLSEMLVKYKEMYIYQLKSFQLHEYTQRCTRLKKDMTPEGFKETQEIKDIDVLNRIFSIINEVINDLIGSLQIDKDFSLNSNMKMDGIDEPMTCRRTTIIKKDSSTEVNFSINIAFRYLDIFFLKSSKIDEDSLFGLVALLAEEMFHLRQLMVLDFVTKDQPYDKDPAEMHAKHGAIRYIIEKAKVSNGDNFWSKIANIQKIQQHLESLKVARESVND